MQKRIQGLVLCNWWRVSSTELLKKVRPNCFLRWRHIKSNVKVVRLNYLLEFRPNFYLFFRRPESTTEPLQKNISRQYKLPQNHSLFSHIFSRLVLFYKSLDLILQITILGLRTFLGSTFKGLFFETHYFHTFDLIIKHEIRHIILQGIFLGLKNFLGGTFKRHFLEVCDIVFWDSFFFLSMNLGLISKRHFLVLGWSKYFILPA